MQRGQSYEGPVGESVRLTNDEVDEGLKGLDPGRVCPGGCPSEHTLHLWRNNKLSEDEALRVTIHLGECQAARDALMALPSQPPNQLPSRASGVPGRRRMWPALTGLAAAAALVLVTFNLSQGDRVGHEGPGVSFGDPQGMAASNLGAPSEAPSEKLLFTEDGRFELLLEGHSKGHPGAFVAVEGALQAVSFRERPGGVEGRKKSRFIEVDIEDLPEVLDGELRLIIVIGDEPSQLEELKGAEVSHLSESWAKTRWREYPLKIVR